MKLLILSSGRAGSTSLQKGLCNSIENTKPHFEPFNLKRPDAINSNDKLKKHIININNLSKKSIYIEKNLIHQPNDIYPNSIIDFYLNYILYFDKVILLVRKDVNEIANSYSNANLNNNWHYFYKPVKNIPSDIKKRYLYDAKNFNNLLYTLSDITKIPIIYYENLFSGNKNYIKNFLKLFDIRVDDFDKFYTYLNPKNRYKRN